MINKPLVSVIFPAKNEGINVKNTLDSIFSVSVSYPFEIIIVDDGSIDGCCNFINSYSKKDRIKLINTSGVGAANARNLGADNATGDYLIFCDAHLLFEDGWIDRLLEPLMDGMTDAVTPGIASTENPSVIGYGQTLTPSLTTNWNKKQTTLFETPILPGGCIAMKRKVFYEIGGFERGFRTWGHEDVELSIKLWLFGYRCHVQPIVTILHVFRKAHPYKISSNEVNYNLLRMAYSHFNEVRIQKCKTLIRPRLARKIDMQVLNGGVLKQRESYLLKRKFNDDWFFNKFKIDF